jgi:hypothetical protein
MVAVRAGDILLGHHGLTRQSAATSDGIERGLESVPSHQIKVWHHAGQRLAAAIR